MLVYEHSQNMHVKHQGQLYIQQKLQPQYIQLKGPTHKNCVNFLASL